MTSLRNHIEKSQRMTNQPLIFRDNDLHIGSKMRKMPRHYYGHLSASVVVKAAIPRKIANIFRIL